MMPALRQQWQAMYGGYFGLFSDATFIGLHEKPVRSDPASVMDEITG